MRYDYNASGYVADVRNDDGSNELIWRLNEQTPTLTDVTLGNGIHATRSFVHQTGQVKYVRASTPGQSYDVQDLEHGFDPLGNLTSRIDQLRSKEERIDAVSGYDALNRLVEVERYTLGQGKPEATIRTSGACCRRTRWCSSLREHALPDVARIDPGLPLQFNKRRKRGEILRSC